MTIKKKGDIDQKIGQHHGETWLEPEDWTYPSGGFLRRARVRLRQNPLNPNLVLPYGTLRIVRASIPDTFYSIPARLRFCGQTIRGFISIADDQEFQFTPEIE